MMEENTQQVEMVRAAAHCGVPRAQLLYAQMLLNGHGIAENRPAAFYWFERAALGGELMAVNMVGRCLDQGWGVPASQRMALPWFRKAAERGLDWGMYNLATLLLLGEDGIAVDRAEAFLWLQQAVTLGHAKSMNLLGGFYEDGWVIKRDLMQARTLYRNAALGGDFRGQFNYARLLLAAGDWLGALHWFRQVPLSATPAFLAKMRSFLMQDALPTPIAEFAATLSATNSRSFPQKEHYAC